jgi:hypothetical protein
MAWYDANTEINPELDLVAEAFNQVRTDPAKRAELRTTARQLGVHNWRKVQEVAAFYRAIPKQQREQARWQPAYMPFTVLCVFSILDETGTADVFGRNLERRRTV